MILHEVGGKVTFHCYGFWLTRLALIEKISLIFDLLQFPALDIMGIIPASLPRFMQWMRERLNIKS